LSSKPLRDDDIDRYGTYELGDFDVHLAPCMGKEDVKAWDAEFFEALICERRQELGPETDADGIVRYHVDLHHDPRFLWFDHLGKFERRLTDEDLAEHNARCASIFHKIERPTWRLARRSILALDKKCRDASKTGKKKK